MYLFIYSSQHVSSVSCSSSGETNFINTASGNCHSVLVAVSCTTLPLPMQVQHQTGVAAICAHPHGRQVSKAVVML